MYNIVAYFDGYIRHFDVFGMSDAARVVDELYSQGALSVNVS